MYRAPRRTGTVSESFSRVFVCLTLLGELLELFRVEVKLHSSVVQHYGEF